jgi:hypothetical protein
MEEGAMDKRLEPSPFALSVMRHIRYEIQAHNGDLTSAARLFDRYLRQVVQSVTAGPQRRTRGKSRALPKTLLRGLEAVNRYRRQTSMPEASVFDTLDHPPPDEPCRLVLAALIVHAESREGLGRSAFARDQLRRQENVELLAAFPADLTFAARLDRVRMVRPTLYYLLFQEAVRKRRKASAAVLAASLPGLPPAWVALLAGLHRTPYWTAGLRRCLWCDDLWIDRSTPPTGKYCRDSHRVRMAEALKASQPLGV